MDISVSHEHFCSLCSCFLMNREDFDPKYISQCMKNTVKRQLFQFCHESWVFCVTPKTCHNEGKRSTKCSDRPNSVSLSALSDLGNEFIFVFPL